MAARDYEQGFRDLLLPEHGIPDSGDDTNFVETTKEETETNVLGGIRVKPFSSKNMFVHHDTHPIVLDIKLMDKYGLRWFEWEPETLWREIMDDFRTPSISDHVKSKVQAIRTIHITDWVFTKWETFSVVTQALNNNIPDFEIMRKPTISQLFAAVDMMMLVRNDVPFSQEVQQWCAASVIDMGVVCAPQPIAFCQDEILEIQNLRGTPIDPKPVLEKYRFHLSTPLEELDLQEDEVDIQIAELMVARDYLSLRREQMKNQLKVLR
jgi:hypothetical protein